MARPRLQEQTDVKPQGYQLRTALKAALKEARAAHAAIGNQKAAITRLFSQIAEAEAALAPLEKAVRAAEKAHVHAVAEAVVLEKPVPASGVAEATAKLVFAQDNIATLRQARKTVEAEIPDYEEAAADADVEVEKIISQVIADYVEMVVLEATELEKQLQPYKSALRSFLHDLSNRPTEYHLMDAYDKSRAPLAEAAEKAWRFFSDLRDAETPAVNPWRSVREGLRQNPDGAVLRHLVAEFDGLLARTPDDERPEAKPAT
jgi:hypothetical protein